MLTSCTASKCFLRIVMTVFAVSLMVGCDVEDGSGQVAAGNVTISGSASGSAGASTGSFSLSWTAPVTRQDGSPISLAEIEGYRVYYGDTQGKYTNMIDVNDGTANAATVTNVPVGDYYVVMTTYDSARRESAQSGVVSKQAL